MTKLEFRKTKQQWILPDRNVGEDVLSNLGHYERSRRTLLVDIFYQARTSVDANRIDPMADTILDQMVPEHRRNTRHSALLYILRSNFTKKFFYSDGCLSSSNETAVGG